MPSGLSQDAKKELFAQQTAEAFLQFIVIEGEDLAAPLRFVNNTQPIVSGGITFAAAKFSMPVPAGKVGNATRLQVSLSNVDRRPTEAVRSVSIRHPLSLTSFVARSGAPDVIEHGPFTFTLRKVTWNDLTLTGDLYDDLGGEVSMPKVRIGPASCPGLY